MADSPSLLPAMKSVRFTEVVSKSGRPETYLLLSAKDATFRKALADSRILSIPSSPKGSNTDYGLVGYDEEQRSQLLIFPKSLKRFENKKVVGIKYDLLRDDVEKSAEPKAQARNTRVPARGEQQKELHSPASKNKPKPQTKGAGEAKVIEFPSHSAKRPTQDQKLKILSQAVQSALDALEKGNSVAAYNALKKAHDASS